MRQTWSDLLFAHWPLDPSALRDRLPAGLALDTFGGEAWVGVIPFRMSGVRLRRLPPVPGASSFPELNVRTYVRAGDRAGVWFFSLDAASAIAVAAARVWFALPYYLARMSCHRDGALVRYRSRRVGGGAPPAEFAASYGPLGDAFQASPGSLEHFLYERYCLFASRRDGTLLRGEIDHAPWAIQRAQADLGRNTMAAAAGIALEGAPALLHFARCQDVRAWAPVRA